METLYPASGFNSEASMSGRPHTPPYTPARPVRRNLARSDSPASTVGSIHPVDTTSPPRKIAGRIVPDNVRVEELVEGDVGYMADVDAVDPEEVEEASSDVEDNNDKDAVRDNRARNMADSEAMGLTREISRLRCGDEREADFEEHNTHRRHDKRPGLRISKRTHSQAVRSETEVTDSDARGDHDLPSSQRRLRRRVRGPRGPGAHSDDISQSSSDVSDLSSTGSMLERPTSRPRQDLSAMDLDSR